MINNSVKSLQDRWSPHELHAPQLVVRFMGVINFTEDEIGPGPATSMYTMLIIHYIVVSILMICDPMEVMCVEIDSPSPSTACRIRVNQ